MTANLRQAPPAGAHPAPASPRSPGVWDADGTLTEIYREHFDSLVRMAAWMLRDTATAQDVVQDSFIATQSAWNRVRNREKALAYVSRAVLNRSRSVLRQQNKELSVAISQVYNWVLDPPPTELDTSEVIREALLSPRQRQVIALTLDGYTISEISGHLGIEPNATRVHLHHARQRLRSHLQDLQETEEKDDLAVQKLGRRPGEFRLAGC